MSFGDETRKVRDEALPIGLRYVSLRHAVELHCPFGFGQTWKYLEEKCGVKEGEPNDSQVLVKCADFIEEDRAAWIKVKQAHEEFIKTRVRLGLPKPKCHCEHK